MKYRTIAGRPSRVDEPRMTFAGVLTFILSVAGLIVFVWAIAAVLFSLGVYR